jgi:hypothetical protein
MNDELRDQIRDLDPMHTGVPTDPVTAPAARQRLETIMSIDQRQTGQARKRPTSFAIAVAAATAVVALIGVVALTGGDDSSPDLVAGPPLELSLGDAGSAMASCMPVSVEFLADMSPAFAATATAVEGETVTLTVDRWYAGGDAAQVVLDAPAGLTALIGGIDFQVGGHYLITAANGTVNYCGYSGEATPELTALFEQAFGS